MEILVPLNKLKFGQDDGSGINARVAGRQEGIAELAANIHANGQIENLVVKPAGDEFYAVSNGNRRLAAFHMIYGETSAEPIRCTLHEIDEKKAFEFSLTTAVTARQLHPVDQYEAFARLEEQDKTREEIAQQYGLTEKEVRQALALGRLAPVVRDAWRKGEIKTEAAQAFTLAADHKRQEKLFKKLAKEEALDRESIMEELDVNGNQQVGSLVDFVGAEAYRLRGGDVTEDLFHQEHIVSDTVLLKTMVDERLGKECDRLVVEQGWQWASKKNDLPSSYYMWPTERVEIAKFFTPEEATLAEQLAKREEDVNDGPYDRAAETAIASEIEQLEMSVIPRAFNDKQKAKLGCVVDVTEDGKLKIEYGIRRPAATTKSEAAARPPTAGEPPAIKAKPKPGSKAAEPDLSQALIERLSIQLTLAAQTALVQDPDLATSVLLATFATREHADGVRASISGLGAHKLDLLGARKFPDNLELARALKPADRAALLVLAAGAALDFQRRSSNDEVLIKGNAGLICDTIKPAAMNAALRGAFDAKDYFASVPKALSLAAIKEALGADIARQQEKKKTPEIAAFAIANVAKTGWLPPSLRVKGYDGPPNAKAKAPTASGVARSAKTDRKKKPPRAPGVARRAKTGKAAPAKKVAKKAVAKKRKAG